MLEVAVVSTKATGEFPNSFNGIEFGTVRGQKVQIKAAGMLLPPGLVDSRMMIGRIVGHDHDAASGNATGTAQLLQELPTSLSIELRYFPAKDKAAIP